MPSRKQDTVKARMCKRRNLIKRYDIVFDGPIPPREWPSKYAPIFRKIREIEDVNYERYIGALTSGQNETSHYPSPISERVADIIRVAYDMRNSLANEATWRSGTENLVLNRFHTDIPCNHCHKRRWFPGTHQLEPLCPLAAEKLRTKRTRTTLCRCTQIDRVRNQSTRQLQSPFLYRGNETIIDDSVLEYQTKELREQKPDLVIGLRQTAKLRSLLSNKPGLIDTPFEKDLSPSFPFLLLEAKPEVGCPGFTSVEEQSAFPLRTLLNIQKNVPTSEDSIFDPLVWFMANQGDEWRIYACVPEDSKTRIIDLWHGTILREDSALQLLLIVDMICDWARDIYRKEIMKCLASTVSDSRGFTPADSNISYSYNQFSGEETVEDQVDELTSSVDTDSTNSATENHPARNSVGSASPGDFNENEQEDIATHDDSDALIEVILTPVTTPDTGIASLDPPTFPDVVMADSSHDDGTGISPTEVWRNHAVIRHANNVILLFRTLRLPEARDDLITLLASTSTSSDIAQAAGELVMLFHARNQILIRKSTIRQLEAWWTSPGGAQEPSNNDGIDIDDDDDDDIVIAHFSFESYFRQDDWELVRKLTCTVATSNTIENLARISGIDPPMINNYREEFRCISGNFLNVTLCLRDLSFEESAKGAISNPHFYLCQDYADFERSRPHFEWSRSTRQNRLVIGALEHVESLIAMSTSERRGQMTLPLQNVAFELKFGPKTKMIGALLAKRRELWPDSCPKYCLVVFDQSDIQDYRAMASKISESILHQSFFQETRRGISQMDASALTLWARILNGETPLDSAWPS